MPYEVVKRGNEYHVQKKGGGRVFGRHKSRAKANKQLAALYANERSGPGLKRGMKA